MTDGWMPPRRVIYQLDTGGLDRSAALRSVEWRERFLNFLYAHGIRYGHFIMGTSITVRVHEDGTLWLHTWQAVDGLPKCEHCPGCIRQERVAVQLSAPVLDFPGCFIKQGWRERLAEVPTEVT